MRIILPIIVFFYTLIFAFVLFKVKESSNERVLNEIQQITSSIELLSDKICAVIKEDNNRTFEYERSMLLISLNQNFYNDSEFQILLDTVDRGTALGPNDIKIASRYLDFFEPFYLLIKKGYINIELTDDMFAYRFFAIVNNPIIQDALIVEHYSYYGNIFRLHKIWITYRKEKNLGIVPMHQSDLSNYARYEEMCAEE